MKKIVFLLLLALLYSCDSVETVTKNEVIDRDSVASIDELPSCGSEDGGVVYYVENEKHYYMCAGEKWVSIGTTSKFEYACSAKNVENGYAIYCDDELIGSILNGEKGERGGPGAQGDSGVVGDSGKVGISGSSCAVISVTESLTQVVCGADTVSVPNKSFESKENEIELFSLSGYSQKGPFVKGAKIYAYELQDGLTLMQTGNSFMGVIENDKGEFNVSGVSLASQYVVLKADGFYRNEVSGEISTSAISLNAITDLSDRSTANVNLLTHLEYERVRYLVQNEGYGVKKAKKKAESEIFKIFYIDADGFDYSEDLNILDSGNENAALLAVSVLLLGDRTEGEVTDLLSLLAQTFAIEGDWNDTTSLLETMDWAANADTTRRLVSIRNSIKQWSSVDVPDFESHIRWFWYKGFGLNECTTEKQGDVQIGKNAYDENAADVYYICDQEHWRNASMFDRDTSHWGPGVDAEVRQGLASDTTYYYFDKSKNVWRVATIFERDVYNYEENRAWNEEECSEDGALMDGAVTASNKYVCDDGVFRESTANDRNSEIGCTSYTRGITSRVSVDTDRDCTENGWIIHKDILVDERDGNEYKIIRRYKRWWMAENLRFTDSTKYENLKRKISCYDNDEKNCEEYGVLYSWTAAMNIDNSYVSVSAAEVIETPHQGICMAGWHVPTKAEYEALVKPLHFGNCLAVEGWYEVNPWGFSALFNGYTYSGTSFSDLGTTAYMWTSTENSATKASHLGANKSSEGFGNNDKGFRFGLRCIKDEE